MHRSTQKVVIAFSIHVDCVEGLNPSQSVYSLHWAANKSKGLGNVTGTTKKVLLTDGCAAFNEVFEVTTSMFQGKGGKFESKMVKFSLQEEAGKGGKKIQAKTQGKLVLELSEHCNAVKSMDEVILPFVGTKQKPPPYLRMRLKATWIKVDGKVLSVGGDAVKSDGTKRETVEVGGQQMFLMTDQEVSEGSDPEEDKEDPFVKESDSGGGGGVSGYAGNALFRTMGGGYEAPASNALPSSFALMEEAKHQPAPSTTSSSSSNPFSNNPFAAAPSESAKHASQESSKTPAKVESSSSSKTTTTAPAKVESSSSSKNSTTVPAKVESSSSSSKNTTTVPAKVESSSSSSSKNTATVPAKVESSSSSSSSSSKSNAVESSSSSKAAAAPANSLSSSSKSTVAPPESGTPLSPGAQELEVLRKQNRSLKELLDRQDAKIEELRSRMKSNQEVSTKLAETEKSLSSLKASSTAEKQQLASMEAAFLAQKAKCDELVSQLAAEKKKQPGDSSTKKLEAEVATLRKQLDDVSQQLAAEKKRNVELTASLSKKGGGESTQKADATTAAEMGRLKMQLDAANHELSGKQLAILELTKRLTEAESASAEAHHKVSRNPLEGEIASLKMQIVAMEQDYEGQLENLRRQLRAAQGANPKSSGDEGYSSTLEKSTAVGEEPLSRASVISTTAVVSKEEFDKMLEVNKKRIEQLEAQLVSSRAVAGPAAPLTASGSEGVDAIVMRGVEEAVWNAPVDYDDEGVGAAARLIVGVVTENPSWQHAPKLHLAMAKAISRSAENQVGLQGKCYWLNVVTQLLHAFSSSSQYSVRSPRDFGIDVSTGAAQSIKGGNLGTFPSQIVALTLSTYQMIVDEIRARVLSSELVKAVFDPAISAGAKLGTKHHVKSGPSVDHFVAELDSCFKEVLAAHLFPSVLRQMFSQIFYDMGAALFNSMLKRPEMCRAGRGIEVKLSLASFDGWPSAPWVPQSALDTLRGVTSMGMNPLREACNLMFLPKEDTGMIRETCPSLNARQLKAFLTSFVPDDMAPDKVPSRVMDDLTEQTKKTDALKIDEKVWLPYQRGSGGGGQ